LSELEFELTDVDPQNFFSRDNLNSLKSSFPKLKLVQRGQTIKALGEKSELKLFDNKFRTLLNYYSDYNNIDPDVINDIVVKDIKFNGGNYDEICISSIHFSNCDFPCVCPWKRMANSGQTLWQHRRNIPWIDDQRDLWQQAEMPPWGVFDEYQFREREFQQPDHQWYGALFLHRVAKTKLKPFWLKGRNWNDENNLTAGRVAGSRLGGCWCP